LSLLKETFTLRPSTTAVKKQTVARRPFAEEPEADAEEDETDSLLHSTFRLRPAGVSQPRRQLAAPPADAGKKVLSAGHLAGKVVPGPAIDFPDDDDEIEEPADAPAADDASEAAEAVVAVLMGMRAPAAEPAPVAPVTKSFVEAFRPSDGGAARPVPVPAAPVALPVDPGDIPALGDIFVVEKPIVIEHNVPPSSPYFAVLEYQKELLAAQSLVDQRVQRQESRKRTLAQRARKRKAKEEELKRDFTAKLAAAQKEREDKRKEAMTKGGKPMSAADLEKQAKETEAGIAEIRAQLKLLLSHCVKENRLIGELQDKVGVQGAIPIVTEDQAANRADRGTGLVEGWIMTLEEAGEGLVEALEQFSDF
jgi:hypothetical protein